MNTTDILANEALRMIASGQARYGVRDEDAARRAFMDERVDHYRSLRCIRESEAFRLATEDVRTQF
jgi:hypothetical protein